MVSAVSNWTHSGGVSIAEYVNYVCGLELYYWTLKNDGVFLDSLVSS